MRNHGALLKVVGSGVTFCLLASLAVLACSPQAVTSPTVTPKQTPTSTATVTPKPTPTPTPTGQPQYGGTLKVAERTEGDAIGYPAKVVNLYSVAEDVPAVEPLLRNDAAGNLVPWLATAFTNNAAAKTITFTLRKGVKFHDGTDFNAAAVK